VADETHENPEHEAPEAAEADSKTTAAKAPAKSWFPTKFDHDLEHLRSRLAKPKGPCDPASLAVIPWGPKQVEGYVDFPAADVVAVCKTLRDDPECNYEILMCVSAVDYKKEDERVAMIYHLLSIKNNKRAQVRAWIPKSACEIDTVESIWPAANWHERETYDLMGVVFKNHSDLRRILCPEDWVGFPLRKDYEFPKEYHGISCV
jgi:NADH-quinone oxidoreductase subunit C